jgi:hypothetical protein
MLLPIPTAGPKAQRRQFKHLVELGFYDHDLATTILPGLSPRSAEVIDHEIGIAIRKFKPELYALPRRTVNDVARHPLRIVPIVLENTFGMASFGLLGQRSSRTRASKCAS